MCVERNVIVKVVSTSSLETLTDCCSVGGGGAAELGVYPGQSDLPQEVPRPGGGKHAGKKTTATSCLFCAV